MQNNSKIKRPPKPTWGTEITMPSELNELNENDFSIVESQDVSGILLYYKNKSHFSSQFQSNNIYHRSHNKSFVSNRRISSYDQASH